MIFADPSTSLIFILEWNSLLWSSPWCWTVVRVYGRVSTCKSLRGPTVFSLHHCPCCSSLPQNGGWLRNKQICLVARSLSRWKPESINFTPTHVLCERALWTRLLNTEQPACWYNCTPCPRLSLLPTTKYDDCGAWVSAPSVYLSVRPSWYCERDAVSLISYGSYYGSD